MKSQHVGMGIYIASKMRHARRWRDLRESGVPIVSTWIDEASEGETSDLVDLWSRCIREASTARALVLYVERGDRLGGVLVEVGAAITSGVPVFWIGPVSSPDGGKYSVAWHPGVTWCWDMQQAIEMALGEAAPRAFPRAYVAGDPLGPWPESAYTDEGAFSTIAIEEHERAHPNAFIEAVKRFL